MADRVVREAVAIFHDPARLQDAVDDLLIAGFDRSHLSLLAPHHVIERELGHACGSVTDFEDDPAAPRTHFIGCDSRTEGMAAAAGTLAYIAAVAAAGAVAASGGTLGLAIGLAAVAGGGGFSLGAYAAGRIDALLEHRLAARLEHGGVLLWVETPTPRLEDAAYAILRRNGAEDVHLHDLPRADAVHEGGVSRDLTWIGKPILRAVLGTRAEPAASSRH